MKKTLGKIIFAALAVAVLSTVLALGAIAATSNLCPQGIDRNDPDFIPSGYSDIDENDGWVMINHPSVVAGKTKIELLPDGSLSQPKYCYGNGYYSYFHERMGKLVYVISGTSFSGNWGDEKTYSQAEYDASLAAGGSPRYIRNVDEVGARYMQVYWNTVNTEKVKILELRLPTDRASTYIVSMNNPGYATWGLKNLETILFDYRVQYCNYLTANTTPFNHSTTLVSAGHVEFALDGSVVMDSARNTFTEGEIDLTAITKIYSIASATQFDYVNMLQDKTNIKKVIFFDSLINKDGTDATYRVPKGFFKRCTGLREIIFPAELGNVGLEAFYGCTDLTIYLKGGFSDDLTFDVNSGTGKTTAFTNAKNITFVVNKKSDVARLRTILDAQGIDESLATIETTDLFEPALYPHGYTARTETYNGIRGIFSFRSGTAEKNATMGYSINEYGVVACSLARYKSFGGTPEAVYNTSNRAIKKMIVYGPANSTNLYINNGTKTFCLSVKNVAEKYYNTELCIFAYEKWINPAGETEIYFTQLIDPNNPDKHWTTLYAETKTLYDSGKVTTSSPGYTKVIKPVLDSVQTLALPVKKEDYI